MAENTLRIAHVTRERSSLPFKWDNERILAIKEDIQSNKPLEIDERFYYDYIANDIMTLIEKSGSSTTAAFLIMQLPFFHVDIIDRYIEAVDRDKNPLGAYFAITLKEAVKTEEEKAGAGDNYEDLIKIILEYGDVPLWIESIRNLPSMPMEDIIKKVGLSSKEHIALWNKEIGAQAKKSYEELLESLKTPVKPRPKEPVIEEVQNEEIAQTRLHKLKGRLGSPINAIKNLKKTNKGNV